ncbi:MAG: aldo/keto reductase [Phycisphaerae bacterium]
MWTKPYGNTGKDVSVISFGGMRFPQPDQTDEMAEIVLHAYKQGVNYFDTAPGYCGDKSEGIMGAAIGQMEPGTFYTSTKCSSPKGDELRKSLERSLDRLGVETIDFFHVWCLLSPEAWQGRKDGGAVAAALKAKEEGLINHLVVSSHMPGDQLGQVLSEGIFEGVTLGYCAINFPFRDKAVDLAGQKQLGVVTMNPLGGGLIPQHAERFDFIRSQDDPDVVSAALRFNVSNPSVTSALVGFSTKEHVDQAVAAVKDFTPYPAEHVQKLRKKIFDSFEGLCTGCGYCLPCPEGLEVPKFMDTYNQRILKGDEPSNMTNRMKWHWGLKAADAKACSLCGACETRCTQHLPIRDRLKEIAALAEE